MVKRILLLGGGQVLMKLSEKLRDQGMDVPTLTSPRLLTERWDGVEFGAEMKRRGFKVWVQDKLDTDQSPLKEVDGSVLGISLGATWIFRENVIRLFNGNLFNCHPSCLPEGRGGGGFSWRILQGDRRGSCVIHRVDRGVDSGEIVYSQRFDFPVECRIPQDFFNEQQGRDYEFILEFIDQALKGTEFQARPQREDQSTYWPRLETPLHGAIDWSWSADEIERFVCAFDEPYAGAFSTLYGNRIHLKDCRRVTEGAGFHPFCSGLVYRISEDRLHVSCRDGNLVFKKATDSTGISMRDSIRPGDRFFTPSETLEKAVKVRVFYSSVGITYQGDKELRDAAVSGS